MKRKYVGTVWQPPPDSLKQWKKVIVVSVKPSTATLKQSTLPKRWNSA